MDVSASTSYRIKPIILIEPFVRRGTMSSTGDNLDLLREAIARNAGMVLSLPSGGILRHHKSRFLADAGDGFWVKSVAAEGPLVEQLIANQQPAGVSFRSGDHKVIFATEIQHFKADYELSGPVDDPDGTRVEALLLRFPGEVRSVQRRKSFRVPVAGTDLQVKVWTMPEQANLRDKPATSREIACEARDLSVGGIGLNIRATVRPPNVATGDRIRVQLTLHDTTALLEGRLRYPPRVSPDSSFRAGVQFKALGDSRDDRAASAQLNKIVNDVQREQIRRKKLGLS